MQLVGATGDAQAQVEEYFKTPGLRGSSCCDGIRYSDRCTHLVLCKVKRTEKLLARLAAGGWVMRVEWLAASSAAGGWLQEAEFEHFAPGDATTPFGGSDGTLWAGAARKHRLHREQHNCRAFEG